MATSEQLGFWSIYIDVSGDWNCVASKDRAGLGDRNKFKARSGAPFALLFDIIDKIKKATSATPNPPDISVSLDPDPKGGFLIVMDTAAAAGPPSITAMPTVAATTGAQAKASLTMAKKSAPRKARVHKSKPRKPKDEKSKPAKSTPRKPKAEKSTPRKSKPAKSEKGK